MGVDRRLDAIGLFRMHAPKPLVRAVCDVTFIKAEHRLPTPDAGSSPGDAESMTVVEDSDLPEEAEPVRASGTH